ncbi:MAG TPA: DoxX family protein [Bacteroidales bacterium]|nr:DoxX family protein [Bacteroidales bacterium]HRX97825.1 DoxX family protein [Bacteroidales bacterium]
MNSIVLKYRNLIATIKRLNDFPLLFFRWVLAYGFWVTGSVKWQNIEGVAQWFESLGYPLPTLNAYMAASTEIAGVILLTLGLGTRLISIPLIIVMIVAITTVHLGNGFNAGDNGFEIPLYYLLMLFALLVYGPGRISIDHLIGKSRN